MLVLALGTVLYWAADGAHFVTKTQVQVPVENDLFETTTMEWKDEFHPGLEIVGPITFILLLGAGFLFMRDRKEKKRLSP